VWDSTFSLLLHPAIITTNDRGRENEGRYSIICLHIHMSASWISKKRVFDIALYSPGTPCHIHLTTMPTYHSE